MRKLAHLTLWILAAVLPAIGFSAERADAAAATHTAQLGGGYRMTVTCEGTKVTMRRLAGDELFVSCSDSVERTAPAATGMATGGLLRLDPGQSVLLSCRGDRLKAKRKGGARMSASCTETAPAAV